MKSEVERLVLAFPLVTNGQECLNTGQRASICDRDPV